MIGFL